MASYENGYCQSYSTAVFSMKFVAWTLLFKVFLLEVAIFFLFFYLLKYTSEGCPKHVTP